MGFYNAPSVASAVLATAIIVADPAAAGGGSGTWASPYTPAEARAAIAASTSASVELWLKSGVHRATYIFDTAKQRQVKVRGQLGKTVQVIPANNVTSGWTQHGTYTNLWYRTHSWDWVSPSSNFNGGIVDVTAGQNCRHWVNATGIASGYGQGIGYNSPFRVFSIAAANGSLATLNTLPMTYMVDTVAQRMYINATAGRVCVTTNASNTVNIGTKCGITSASLNVTVVNTFGIAPGQTVTGPGIPAGATVATVTNGTTFVLAAGFAATATNASAYLSIGSGADSTAGLTTGQTVIGTGIPASTTITVVDNNTLTLSAPATATSAGVILGFSVDPNTRTFEVTQATYGVYYGAILPSGTPGGIQSVVDTDANMQELFLEGIEGRYAYGSNFAMDRVLLDARNCASYGAIGSHGWTIGDSHGSLTACKSVTNFGDGFNNLGLSTATYPVPPIMTFTGCEGHGAISVAGDGYSNHIGLSVIMQGCKADGNAKNGFSPVGDHVLIDCSADGNANGGIVAVAYTPKVKSVIKNFRAAGNFAGILVNGAGATDALDVQIERPIVHQNYRGIYLFQGSTPVAAITGQIIAPQYSQNVNFTIATLSLTAISLVTTFTTT